MKIYSNIDTDTRTFEGRTQLARKLTEFLQAQGYQFIKNPAEADLIHFHSSGIGDSYTAYKLQQQYKVPCIYSLYSTAQTELLMHPVNFWIQKWYFQKTATRFLPSYSAALPLRWRSQYLKKLHTVVVPLEIMKEKMHPNTALIRLGVDTNQFTPKSVVPKPNAPAPNAPSNTAFEKIPLKVAYIGHPGVFKGLNDFVTASREFPSGAEMHIFLTERFDNVDHYIRERNSQCTIHGHIDNMTEVYRSMDLVVLPYRTQIGTVANPLVLLEAMSCGKAIVSTKLPFIQEVVEDAGLLVEPYSPKALAAAVTSLLNDPRKRAELGAKARERVVEQYSLQEMHRQYLMLYQEIEKSLLKK